MIKRTRNVYITIPTNLHLEVRTLGLRNGRTVDDLYTDAVRLLLERYGVPVACVEGMDLTAEVERSTI